METITDYAMPLMKLEKLNKQMHDLCLSGKYMEACELTQHVLVEARILSASLILMHEKTIDRDKPPVDMSGYFQVVDNK